VAIDERARIRSYLQAQGAKLTPAELVEKVQGAMRDLRAAAALVPPDRFAQRPGAADWSGNEVLAHVVAAGRYFGGAIVALAAGAPLPARPASLGADGAPSRTAEEWLETLDQDRAILFAHVLTADPAGHLDGTVEHPFFGPLNWRETLLFMRLHDLDHAGQLQQIAAALA
jgi:DinB superfamily